MSSTTKAVNIDSIRVDERTQQRPLSGDNITRLAELLADGHDFSEPIEVFRDEGGTHYLAHGHHRYHAYNQAEYTTVEAVVYEGGLEDAIDHSCKPLNALHGQPETRADREKRVKTYIERHPDLSHNAIAKHCGVSDTTVKKYRESQGSQSGNPKTRTGADGKPHPASKPKPNPSGNGSTSQSAPSGGGGNSTAATEAKPTTTPTQQVQTATRTQQQNGAERGGPKERIHAYECWKNLWKAIYALDEAIAEKHRDRMDTIAADLRPPEK